jgi:hypothetical protein
MSIFGDILSGVIDLAAFPLKLSEEIMGQAIGSDGKGLKDATPVPSDVTDKMKEIVKNVDRGDE